MTNLRASSIMEMKEIRRLFWRLQKGKVTPMKICPNCNQVHDNDQTQFCTTCGADLSQVPPQEFYGLSTPVPPSMSYPLYSSFTWVDVFSIVGFVAALIGLFWASVILLPVGIICSVIGFFSRKTRAIAIAGLTISIIGLLIKLCMELYQAGMIPEWLTRGIFF